jgi:polysaccharide export outer membrane protein
MSQNAITTVAVCLAVGFAGCAATARAATPAEYPTYTALDAAERIFPGDEIEVTVHSAPELSRTLRVAPDGRVRLPMARESVMVANLTAEEAADAVRAGYVGRLRDPQVEVAPRFGPRQVFVGGEVQRPGIYELPPGADALQAVLLAGGFTNAARRDEVLMLRRAVGGQQHAMLMNLDPRQIGAGATDAPPVARHDVIWAPKKPISQLGLFVQQYVRDAIPVNFTLAYDLRDFNR